MDRRARLLPVEYKKKRADVDREYYGTVPGQVGPLQAKLQELAGCSRIFWAWVSGFLETLVQISTGSYYLGIQLLHQ